MITTTSASFMEIWVGKKAKSKTKKNPGDKARKKAEKQAPKKKK